MRGLPRYFLAISPPPLGGIGLQINIFTRRVCHNSSRFGFPCRDKIGPAENFLLEIARSIVLPLPASFETSNPPQQRRCCRSIFKILELTMPANKQKNRWFRRFTQRKQIQQRKSRLERLESREMFAADYVAGELLIQFEPGYQPALTSQSIHRLSSIVRRARNHPHDGNERVERWYPAGG